jgi:hypothetical protein
VDIGAGLLFDGIGVVEGADRSSHVSLGIPVPIEYGYGDLYDVS